MENRNKLIAFFLCVCLIVSFSGISVFASYEETVKVTFIGGESNNGKATITMSILFPRTEEANYLYLMGIIGFSADGVYLDHTDLTSNGKEGKSSLAYYLRQDDGVTSYWTVGKDSNPKYDLFVEVNGTCSENPINIEIPLSIPETITDTITVTGTDKGWGYTLVGLDNGTDVIVPEYISGTITIGSGASTPTEVPAEDITNSTGEAATVTGSITDGTATLNVASDKACVVAYTTDGGVSYTRLNATANAASGYDFAVADYTDSMKFVVAVKGDLNGDGTINAAEAAQVKAAQLGKLTLTTLQSMAADLDGNGTINAAEAAQVKAAQLGKLALNW